jgi:CheY-like chemotaxis protein
MRKTRILYVDDEVGAARLLGRNLEATGRYEVRVENWPEDAVKVARDFKPDLVLLDIIMPRMPGGNVAEAFENDPELRAIQVVFFTAAVWRHQVEEHEGIICDHPCLAKPSDLKEIISFIEQNLPPHCREEVPPLVHPTGYDENVASVG